MDRLRILIIGCIGFLLLIGCTIASHKVVQPNNDCYQDDNEKWIICDKERGYTFWYPRSIQQKDWQQREINVYTYDFPCDPHLEEGCQKDTIPKISCSPDTLGDDAPHWTPLEHIVQTHDAQRDILTITAMQPPEPPPVEMEPQRLQEWKENERYRYLFCSAHKGKAVKIVITQVKDNPTLAQKIFETFRWKE